MIKNIGLILAASILMGTATVQAQTSPYAYGLVPGMIEFKITDMLDLNQHNRSYTTARASAMGGAFTSLGADLSSLHINPAGLGMYTTSEVGVSFGIGINKSSVGWDPNGGAWNGNNTKTRFAPNNIAGAVNVYQSSGNLTSITIGFGYNKLADFNNKTSLNFPGMTGDVSILNVFRSQLKGESEVSWYRHNLARNQLPAAMAYRLKLIEPEIGGGEGLFNTYVLSPDAVIHPSFRTISSGRIAEYSFGLGMNFRNTWYFGASFGFHDTYLKQTVMYDENYSNNNGALNPVQGIYFDQTTWLEGVAVDMKLGLTYRPIEPLRIGVAIHAPLYSRVSHSYDGYMWRDHGPNSNESNGVSNQFSLNSYYYTNPVKLLAGISYTFRDIAIISFDYEKVWYQSMRMIHDDPDAEWFKNEFKEYFKGSDIFRVGLEVKPHPRVALRAGFADYGSMLKDNDTIFDNPVPYHTQNISGGLGFRITPRWSLDLAYVFMKTDYTTYDLFYHKGYNNDNSPLKVFNIDLSTKRHNVIVSASFKF